VQLEIRPDPAEVGRARRWARSRLAGSGMSADEPVAETLVLLVSELVTNAVVHTGCPAVLRLLLTGVCEDAGGGPAGTVRLEVADSCDRAPAPRRADGDATGGRGLALVDGLADRWGWTREGGGKRIWCEMDRGTAGPPDASADTATPTTHGEFVHEAVQRHGAVRQPLGREGGATGTRAPGRAVARTPFLEADGSGVRRGVPPCAER